MDLSILLILAVAGAVALFIALIALYWAYDARRVQPAHFFSFQGKDGVISNELSSHLPNVYCYQIKVEGEIWKARSQKAVAIGATVKIRGKDADGLTLII